MILGGGILAAAAVVAVVVGWRRRAPVGVERDWSEVIVKVSARRLASTRPDWGRAMVAELSALEDRPTRLRFALGCARTALAPPLADASPAGAARVVVAAAAAAVIGLGLVAQRDALAAPAIGQHGASYEFAATLAGLLAVGSHSWLVDRRARQTTARAAASRRCGVTVGVIVGVSALVVWLPVPGEVFSSSVADVVANVAFPLVIAGCLFAGLVAARASGDAAGGREAGVWAGRVAGSIMAIGLLAATVWAMGWFTHDPSTIHAYQDSLSSAHYGSYHTHFRAIAGFVLSENVDTALIGSLLWFPLTGLLFGALGGFLGAGPSRPAAA